MGDVTVGEILASVYPGEDGWYFDINDETYGPYRGHDDARYHAVVQAGFIDECRKLSEEGWTLIETGNETVPVIFERGQRVIRLAQNRYGRWVRRVVKV